MANKTSERVAREQQRRFISAAAIGLNALRPIMRFQASMLRLWAQNIERFAGNYEEGAEKTVSSAEEQSKHERAA
jgi:hypothetical protein